MAHDRDTEARKSYREFRVLSPWKLIGVSGVLLLVLLLAAWQPIRVTYHRWRMQTAWDAVHSPDNSTSGGGLAGYVLGEDWEEHEYHRDQLVHLGEIHFHDFRFEHIMTNSDESGHLLHRMMRGECPPNLHWESSSPNSPAPLQLNLWCQPADSAAWESFVAENDVANYQDQHMAEEPETHR